MPAASKTAFDSPQLPSPNPSTSACNQTASKQPVQYGKLTPQMQPKSISQLVYTLEWLDPITIVRITSRNFYPSVSTLTHTETQQITEKQPGPGKGAWVSSPGRGQQQQQQPRLWQQLRQHRAPEQGSATHCWQRGAERDTAQGQKGNGTRASFRQGESLPVSPKSQRGFLGFSWSTQFAIWLFKRKGMLRHHDVSSCAGVNTSSTTTVMLLRSTQTPAF